MKTLNSDMLRPFPFFEIFEEPHLAYLASKSQLATVDTGERLLEEGQPAERFYVLISGKIELSFRQTGLAAGRSSLPHPPGEEHVHLRFINDPGYPFGWSSMVAPFRYRATATALEPSEVVFMERAMLEAYAEHDPAFGLVLMSRVLRVVGRRLRETRVRLISRRYRQEILAIRALLEQNAADLHVTSPLHKIPYYLEHRMTLADAFYVLEVVHVEGDEQERYIADLCLDILDNVRKELALFQYLQTIYELVANAPPTMTPEEVNTQCCLESIRMFTGLPHLIEGEEHLPKEPGHIFIMNHLHNHIDYLLPNDFHYCFDTHFVSSMLLYRSYGTAPIRVVRKSGPGEYGHRKYYDRLGHLYVHTVSDPVERHQLRKEFFQSAHSYLNAGMNIVICPEGSCTSTEASPLPFKAGAFRMAAGMHPEPLIVPVVVAYFDHKITRTMPVILVKEPFRVSERLDGPVTEEALQAFTLQMHRQYQGYVQEARERAR